MIKVVIRRQNKLIVGLEISGHSMSAEKGKDLVCAGVSAIGIGGLNAIYQIDSEAKLSMEDGFISISGINSSSLEQMVLTTIIVQLKTIQEKYPTYILITETQ